MKRRKRSDRQAGSVDGVGFEFSHRWMTRPASSTTAFCLGWQPLLSLFPSVGIAWLRRRQVSVFSVPSCFQLKRYGLALLLFLLSIRSYAQPFSIDWHTIDGAGGTSSGDAFSLSDSRAERASQQHRRSSTPSTCQKRSSVPTGAGSSLLQMMTLPACGTRRRVSASRAQCDTVMI